MSRILMDWMPSEVADAGGSNLTDEDFLDDFIEHLLKAVIAPNLGEAPLRVQHSADDEADAWCAQWAEGLPNPTMH